MAEYIGCYVDQNNKLHYGTKIEIIKDSNKDWGIFNFLHRLNVPVTSAKIYFSKKEAIRFGIDIKKNPKGGYVICEEGIRIPIFIK